MAVKGNFIKPNKYHSKAQNDLYNYISKYPVISREKEQWEFRKPKPKMDRALIVNSNLRAVYKIANTLVETSYDLTNDDFMDLFNSGIIGLNIAIDRFDPTYSVRFATYSFYWIRVYIWKERENKKLIKHTSSYNIDNLSDMEEIRSTNCPSIIAPEVSPNNNLNMDMDEKSLSSIILSHIKDDIDKMVFVMYFYDGLTFREIGFKLGLTRRQIIHRMGKVKKIIKSEIDPEYLKGLLKGAI